MEDKVHLIDNNDNGMHLTKYGFILFIFWMNHIRQCEFMIVRISIDIEVAKLKLNVVSVDSPPST